MTSAGAIPTATNIAIERDDSEIARATVRRVSVMHLPFLFVLYICAHVDRTNVGIASLQMNRDLHFSAAAYGFGASIFYLGYALFEVPSNLILARIGARRWIARIMITWGLLATSMMFVRTPAGFYVLRFLLGVAEAGFFPGVVYYMTGWFPAAVRARAVSRFMLALPAATIISGSLAGPLLGLQGRLSLAGWQWLFLIEGLPAVMLGFAVLAYLPDRAADARWLDPRGRAWLTERMRAEHEACASSHGASLRRALASGRVWQLGLVWAVMYVNANAYTFWAPQLIKDLFARSAGWVGVVLALVALASAVGMLLNGAHSDRRRERWGHVGFPFAMTAIAWLVVTASVSPAITLLALGLVQVAIISLYGPFWCLPSDFLTGEAAAGGLALISSIGSLGGFAGPNIVGMAQRVAGSQRAGFVFLACLAGAAAVFAFYRAAETRRRG